MVKFRSSSATWVWHIGSHDVVRVLQIRTVHCNPRTSLQSKLDAIR